MTTYLTTDPYEEAIAGLQLASEHALRAAEHPYNWKWVITAMRYQDFEACIFDFDGVIIDSEPLHAEAKRVTLDHFCVQYPDTLFADFKGRPDTAFFDFVAISSLLEAQRLGKWTPISGPSIYSSSRTFLWCRACRAFWRLRARASENSGLQPRRPVATLDWPSASINSYNGSMQSSRATIRLATSPIQNPT